MDVYGIIMAGGGGSRFWPLSRQATPKQLLNLTGKDLMVNETLDRMGLVIPGKNMYIVTNCTQALAMKQAVHGRVLPGQILAEPAARNTAACIGYAAFEVLKKRGDGILCVAPSDAYIRDWPAFAAVLETAVKAAEQTNQLVTIGIQPTFPATGYGYIQYDPQEHAAAHKVLQFKEKPDEATAKRYLTQGGYAWNSGMFIWKASVILEQYRRYLPQVYEQIEQQQFSDPVFAQIPVRLYEDPLLPLAALYNLNKQTEEALQPKVWMKSGGYLVIEPTEALTVVDVNTGKSVNKKNRQEHFLKINLEAAEETAAQLRLRNISGIVIIDFINLEQEEDRNTVMEHLRRCVKVDSVPVQVIDMTKLNLVELTRKKVEKSLAEQLTE